MDVPLLRLSTLRAARHGRENILRLEMLKTATKKLLHAAGFELRRVNHDPGKAEQYKFAPSEEDKFNWLKSLNIRTVLDIGANTGQFAADIHQILPEAMLYSFEPLKDCYRQLVENMKHVPNFRAFDFALGDDASEIEMHRSEFSPSSSILPMGDLHKQAFPFTSGEVLERIIIKRLDDVARDLELVDNILIKIDVQGFEDRVIAGGHETLQRATVLIVETSFHRLYEGQPLFDTIYDMLRQMGFGYYGNFIQLLNPVDGSVLQADAIFMKANEQAATR
jgi:FkbM family methyltransferase